MSAPDAECPEPEHPGPGMSGELRNLVPPSRLVRLLLRSPRAVPDRVTCVRVSREIVESTGTRRRAIARMDSPPRKPRGLSFRSASDGRGGHRQGFRDGSPPVFTNNPCTVLVEKPTASAASQ